MTITIRLPKPAEMIKAGFFVACFLGCIWIFASALAEVTGTKPWAARPALAAAWGFPTGAW